MWRLITFPLEAFGRITRQRHHSWRWFNIDKPARVKAGYVPDGLTDKERSEADKERLPTSHAEYNSPNEQTPFQAELRRRWG